MRKTIVMWAAAAVCMVLAGGLQAKGKVDAGRALAHAACQYLYMKSELKGANRFPKTYDVHTRRLKTSASDWWCSGFYPGTLFYLYEATGNRELYREGVRMLKLLEPEQYNVHTHDVGFMMYCSFGNALRIAPQPEYKDILVNSARSLVSRFNPAVGCIRSHDRKPDDFVVIIDNMMNLELFTWTSKATGDERFRKMAESHADVTMKNHFRDDYSCYHVVSYDTITGVPHVKQTHQGAADESAWSRGQAWALYGYTMMYRETGKPEYLTHARHVGEYIMNHPNMPADKVPYWDFDAPGIPDTPRDASAAAVMASAFIELSQLTKDDFGKRCLDMAEQQIRSLTSPEYLAAKGTNCHFALMHSTGSFPSDSEVDVPLSYADYYYVEALTRMKKLLEEGSL